jgi:hypothetical protein
MCDCILLQRKIENCVYDGKMGITSICEIYKMFASIAQDRDQWRALVNTVMNLRVP